MNIRFMVLVLIAGIGVGAAVAEPSFTWVLRNPTGREYSNELVRLKIGIPEHFDPAKWRVLEDGLETPVQPEQVGGNTLLWVLANLGKGQKRSYTLDNRAPKAFSPRVTVRREGDTIVMDNGLTAVRVPSPAETMVGKPASTDRLPTPIMQIRLPDGKWVGRGHWRTDRKLKSFEAKVVGDGTLFGKILLDYRFEGVAGIDGVPSFYRAEITLSPDRRHAVIEEEYGMSRGSCWEFDAADGWSPRQALTIPHFGGFDREDRLDADGKTYPFPPQTLKYGQTRMGDTLLNLIPRWSQAYDDGWFFMAHDGDNGVGALVCRAGKWLWPYDGMIGVKVRESGDYAGFHCPTWRGKRFWLLLAGPRSNWADQAVCEEYVLRHSFETLDKLHQEYILDWPGLVPPAANDGQPAISPEEYASGAGRFGRRSKPFFGWGPGRGAISGDDHPITALIRAQVYLDPDTFGDYWRFFSPENPNFATSWWAPLFREVAKCKGHPHYAKLVEMAKMKLREDLYHSVTLPGGAGQECPGYQAGALNHLYGTAAFCRDNLGFDLTQDERFKADASFFLHTSHPMADGSRRSHPAGDTHPPGPDVFAKAKTMGLSVDIPAFVTEELPGFGVVFRNRPGTPRETYLAFKSGPNRGHFHGDQLSFHYCADARPLLVDHHCSYAPHAGQEHMHNRVAFHTDNLPWANMDGYERVIALKTSPEADVVIGQVESERLRITDKFPPQKWDTDLPQEMFDTPLKYRRTIVFLKYAGQDCFVIRDQHTGPDVYATYCLHALGERCEQKGNVFDFDGMQAFVIKPEAFTVSRHDWEHENGGKETTKGLRVTMKGRESEFITVLMPRPIQRIDTLTFVFKNLFQEEVREKGVPPETQKVDLQVVVAWNANGPASAQVSASERVRRRQALEFLGSVSNVVGSAGTLRLSVDGVRGRNEKTRVKFDCDIQLDRKGDAWSGSYAGIVWDVSAMKARQRGEASSGRECGGEVLCAPQKNVVPPIPLFDDTWRPPAVNACPGGVRIGDTEVRFAGGLDDEDTTTYVTVERERQRLLSVTGKDIDMDRSQGEIGLFVPDAGYPFGVIPDWLIRQRNKKPKWYQDLWPPTAKGRTRDD